MLGTEPRLGLRGDGVAQEPAVGQRAEPGRRRVEPGGRRRQPLLGRPLVRPGHPAQLGDAVAAAVEVGKPVRRHHDGLHAATVAFFPTEEAPWPST